MGRRGVEGEVPTGCRAALEPVEWWLLRLSRQRLVSAYIVCPSSPLSNEDTSQSLVMRLLTEGVRYDVAKREGRPLASDYRRPVWLQAEERVVVPK